MSYDVSVVRCATYDETLVRGAVEASLAPLGGLGRFVKAGDRVLLKLNLLSAHAPERAVTTHPMLVKVVVQMAQALGASVAVGDSPGGVSTPASYRALLLKTGIQQVIDDTGCEAVLFDESAREVSSEQAHVFKQFTAVTAPSDADVVISLPKLKTHQFAYYTGAVKLLYGYLPGLTKVEYHMHAGKQIANFAELLLDIYETFPPALNIMDAVVAMEGNGPAHGTPRPLGFILASPSATALDYVACDIIGLNPLQVPTVRCALQRGIGPGRLAEVVVHGEDPETVRVRDFHHAETLKLSMVPSWIADISSWLFATRPVIDSAKCIRCGKCAESCPPHVIVFNRGIVPTMKYGPCLRCYCCQELCPAGAIRVGRPRLRLPLGLIARLISLRKQRRHP